MATAVIELPDIATGTQQDQAAAINAALAQPGVDEVVLPSGVIWIGQAVLVPGGRKLTLQPDTVIRALADFAVVGGINAGILLQASRAHVSGGEVDMNKIGSAPDNRFNGVQVDNGARDCIRRDMIVRNCTGYAVYDSGANELLAMPSSYNENILTFNSQIHLEAQGADGTMYVNCHQRDGDGDIPCLSWIHPLFSTNIHYERCTGHGTAAAAWEITANVADCEDISFDHCDYEQVNAGSICLAITLGQTNKVKRLRGSNSRFAANGGYGAFFDNIERGAFTQCIFSGGYGVQASNSSILFTGCEAYAVIPNQTQAARAFISQGTANDLVWNGGILSWSGGLSASGTWYVGAVTVSQSTLLEPTPTGGAGIKAQAVGRATIQPDGANSYANVFLTYTNINNVALNLSLVKATDGYAQAATTLSWALVDPSSKMVRVRIAGANLATGYSLSWHMVEKA